MKNYFLIGLSIMIISCQKEVKIDNIESKTTCDTTSGKKLEMYQMTEMALLMEQMYVDNKRLKERIIKGDTIGSFPQHFHKIHTATMTDESEDDAFFKEQAAHYITSQQLIYQDPKNAKKHFNNAVDACLKCHEQKCGGPIPRIKKLYIKV
jgi:cytochrome c553